MKKLKYHGYKEGKAELRHMTLGELKLYILRAYADKGAFKTQLIDLTSGESITFGNSEDVLKNEWSDNCEIEVINLPHKFGTEVEYKAIILFQEAECDKDRVIKVQNVGGNHV